MTHSGAGLVCAFALFCVIGCTLPAAASADGIIVRREPGLSATELADVRADAGVKLEQGLPIPDVELVSAPAGGTEQALAALNADPDVRFALPDVPVHVAAAPSDPFFTAQWALDSGNNPDINAPQAWELASSEGAGVTVAVVDQLVNVNHPDLAASIDQRYRADPSEYDYTSPDGCAVSTPIDDGDHGTHVAGTIAAQQDNGIGVTGVAPYAKILPLRAIDNCGGGNLSWVIKAFGEAGKAEIPIVNASLGTDPLLPAARKAEINSLFADVLHTYSNTLYVVAAGNEGNDNDQLPVYPCNTLLTTGEPDNLLCVGMTNRADLPVCWGNVGPTSVDLFAPGIEILSTVTTATSTGYLRMGGTSTATPMVTGAAALLKAEQGPLFSAMEIHDRMLRGVDPYDGMAAISVSGGRLNAGRLVSDGRSLASKPGGSWKSCDRDHDTILDLLDHCPDQPGTKAFSGCADTDGDGLADQADSCPTVANADQRDADGDGAGDLCDATPRGDDPDGDGVPAMDDRCPDRAGTSPDGCPVVVNPPVGNPEPPKPTPTVTPQTAPKIVSLAYKLSKCPKGRKQCAKVATVTVKVSRQANVALKVDRQDRRRGRLVWKRVKSQSLTATARGRSLKVRGRRSRPNARYRVTATLAGKAKAVSFKV